MSKQALTESEDDDEDGAGSRKCAHEDVRQPLETNWRARHGLAHDERYGEVDARGDETDDDTLCKIFADS